MEHISDPIITITGRGRSDLGSASDIIGTVYAPSQVDGDNDLWAAVVKCEGVLHGPKRIAGVDREQAVSLARGFLVQMMRVKGYEIVATEELEAR